MIKKNLEKIENNPEKLEIVLNLTNSLAKKIIFHKFFVYIIMIILVLYVRGYYEYY